MGAAISSNLTGLWSQPNLLNLENLETGKELHGLQDCQMEGKHYLSSQHVFWFHQELQRAAFAEGEARGEKKGKEKNDLLILVLKARLRFKPWAEVHVSSLSKPVHLLLVISSLLSRRRELLCSQREESSQLKNTKELAPAGSSSWKIFFASI